MTTQGRRIKPVERACVVCSQMFLSYHWTAIYCGGKCKADAVIQRRRKRYERQNERRVAKYRRDVLASRPSPLSCHGCGVLFTPLSHVSRRRYCSETCRRRDVAWRNESHAKRARLRDQPWERVRRVKIFERDGWRCRGCGCETPRELIGSGQDKEPTFDHIVAIAAGGGHTKENAQLLCRACNTSKGVMPMALWRFVRKVRCVRLVRWTVGA